MSQSLFNVLHRSRQSAVMGLPVIDPADWKGADLAQTDRWQWQLEPHEIAHFRKMAKQVREVIGEDPNELIHLPLSAFPLADDVECKLDQVRDNLCDGLGVVLIKGLPIKEMDRLDAAIIYWGIGRRLGLACSNNADGDMFGHVTDKGKTQKDPNSRGYQTSEEMAFHCDQSSIVGLLCLRGPMSGGESKICSSVALYNAMLARDPDSVNVLSEPYYWTKHGEKNEDEAGFYTSPVFNFLDGFLCTSLGPTHIRKGHALPGAPAMTREQRQALELASSLAEAQHYAMQMEPGDIQLLNNAVVLHTRTAYQDYPDPDKRRLLWRLWLTSDSVRPLTPYVQQWNAGVKLLATQERVLL